VSVQLALLVIPVRQTLMNVHPILAKMTQLVWTRLEDMNVNAQVDLLEIIVKQT
jgi:hypothetical protein